MARRRLHPEPSGQAVVLMPRVLVAAVAPTQKVLLGVRLLNMDVCKHMGWGREWCEMNHTWGGQRNEHAEKQEEKTNNNSK